MTDDKSPIRVEARSSTSPESQPEKGDTGKDKNASIEVGTEDSEGQGEEVENESPPDADNVNEAETIDENGKEVAAPANPGPWQAIYSLQYNTYYFYNPETQETTWTNPLESSDSTGTSSSISPDLESQGAMESGLVDPHYAALQQAAIAQGIDPALAYLDPSIGSSMNPASAAPGSLAFTAKFNSRTGQFTRPDGRDPDHMSEYERMKRMSEFYFDVNEWEQQLAGQGGSIKGGEEELSKKRKRPSKKDLDRFKEQKRLKKIAKTAWLRT